MRKQTFASASAKLRFKKLRNEIHQKKSWESNKDNMKVSLVAIEWRYSKNSDLSGRDKRHPPSTTQ